MKKYIYYGTTVLLVLIFGPAGLLKLFPQYIAVPGQDFRVAFRQFATIPPLRQFSIDPDLYRIAVGAIEVSCAAILILAQRFSKTQVYVTYGLLVLMAGALYTHAMISDPLDKWGGAIVASILLALRLYSLNRLKVKVN